MKYEISNRSNSNKISSSWRHYFKEAILDVQDNPKLYGEQAAPNYLDDFCVEGKHSAELSDNFSMGNARIEEVENCYCDKRGLVWPIDN